MENVSESWKVLYEDGQNPGLPLTAKDFHWEPKSILCPNPSSSVFDPLLDSFFYPADQTLISKLGYGYKVVERVKRITDILSL